MFKCFFNTSTKNRRVLIKKINLLNHFKRENFSNTDKNNPENKRVKLSEFFNNKKTTGNQKEDTIKIKTMKKTDFFIKKENSQKAINSPEAAKDNQENNQKNTKTESSDRETQQTKNPIVFKAFKSPYNPTKKEGSNQKATSSDDDIGLNELNDRDDSSASKANFNLRNKSFKRSDSQSFTGNPDKNEIPKTQKVINKPIKVMKKNTFRKFDSNKPFNPDNMNEMVQMDEIIGDEPTGLLNQTDSEALNKQKGEEEEILRYMCVPLNMQKIEDIKYKWQQFFISSTRVIPDINRSINNKPDSVYYEYIRDLLDEFTDKQLLFAIKNILLNEDLIKGYEMLYIFRDLFFRLKSHGTFDLSSKVNIVMLYEIFFLFDLIEYKIKSEESSINLINGHIMQMIFMIVDYQRFFFPEFKIEENLMILKAMMDKNVIDVYLIKKFLMQYSEIDIINTLKDCIYKLKYFNTEYNLNLSIFYILDNYVKVCKINQEWQSLETTQFKFLIKRMITEFLNLMKEDKILLSDLIFNNFKFENLVSIFNIEQAEIYTQAINNAIISKVYKELKLISEDKILITDGRTLTQSVHLISKIKKNTYKENLFKETYLLLSDLIHENYTFSLLSTLNEETKLDDPHNSSLLLIYDSWIDGLVEAAIENDIYHSNILEPFMVLLQLRIQKYKLESNSTFLLKKLYYLGKYNFNDILQSEKFNSVTLKNYFKVLDELRNFLPKYLEQIKNNFKTAISTNKFNNNNSTLTLDKDTFKILDNFYTNFFEKEAIKLENNNYGLHYEEDFELSNNVNPYLMRFKIIPKEMYMISYLPSFCKTMSQELKTDFNKDILINHSKLAFGFIAASIKYNVFNIKLANAFINFIITIYSDKTDIFSRHLLEDLDLYRDFIFILTHIFNPEDNFIAKDYKTTKNKKPKNNNKSSEQGEDDFELNLGFLQNLYITEETVMKCLREKYDINKYDFKEKEDFDIHSHKINTLMFKDAITEYIEEDEEIQVFFDKYLEEETPQKHSFINFSNSHSTFMNVFKSKNDSESVEEPNYINEDNSSNKKDVNDQTGKLSVSNIKNKKQSNPHDLYFEVSQIKTFANVKSVMFNNNNVSESQIENLLNDEILFCKILLDMKKISLVINETLKRIPLKTLTDLYNNFYNPEFLLTSQINVEFKKINSEISDSVLNLSYYTTTDIAKSTIFYTFLKEFIDASNRSLNKKNIPVTDVDKNDLVLYNYPIFPMIVPYIVQKPQAHENSPKIDVYQKSQFYRCSSNVIRTQKSYEEFLFLKALLRNQEKNINIYEYNNMI